MWLRVGVCACWLGVWECVCVWARGRLSECVWASVCVAVLFFLNFEFWIVLVLSF